MVLFPDDPVLPHPYINLQGRHPEFEQLLRVLYSPTPGTIHKVVSPMDRVRLPRSHITMVCPFGPP